MSSGINPYPLFSLRKGEYLLDKTIYILRFFSYMLFLLFLILLNGRADLYAADNQTELSNDVLISHESADRAVPAKVGEYNSETFVMPDIFEISINMIYPGEGDKKTELTASIKTFLSEGKEKDAARKLGEILGRERKKSREYLGYYCRKALPGASGDMNKKAQFLSWFLSGYGKLGVLMVSTEGIESLSASGRRRGEFWKVVDEGKVPTGKLERIYRSDDAIYIPFSSGEIFILDIIASGEGEVALWKILPEGVNRKIWAAGIWEREITIRGDRGN